MEQNPVEKQITPSGDVKPLDGSLKALWDRVKQAGESVTRLREENKVLLQQASELEQRVIALEAELRKKDQQLHKFTAEQSVNDAKGTPVFANGEREDLAKKLKEILVKIDAYL
ncbi:MAG: hypothetical protein ACKVRP_15735 [Bacteroidota bacterium]